ncbi:excise, DNA binding domain, excisionase family [uncultured Caudovirales phage]|uniref:Excise, DNA binding domain, excisionase family n=1 Tax=uncultured Caudovirales phage TaxID=2100421 RepID=A0A6J5QZ54_9CAUD|nr:excise, DNA binding domain, excisionase family [uncultured Caudovirales phage]CAB4217047.1 excise, DNA binding domain, excisionase family [uncultured Caudovirales phage]
MTTLSPAQAAAVLGLSGRTVARLIDRGELLATSTPGGHRRVEPEQLLDYQRKRISSTVTVLLPPALEGA